MNRHIIKRIGIISLILAVGVGVTAFRGNAQPPDEGGGVYPDEPIMPGKEAQAQQPEYVPGEILVKFKEGVDPQTVLQETGIDVESIGRVHSIKPAIAQYKSDLLKEKKLEKDSKRWWYWFRGKQYKEVPEMSDEELFEDAYKQMTPARQGLYRNYKINLTESTSVEKTVAQLKDNPNVEYAEPNYKYNTFVTPNDPRFNEQWALCNTGQTGGTDDADIDALEAWDIATGSEDIIIAIVDTGIDYNHEDLAANMLANPEEIPDNGIDDDGNGYIDDVYGYDFRNGDPDPFDGHGHGTHCAGIAGAVSNNDIGIAGVAWNCKIMAVKFLSSSGSGNTDNGAASIIYAVDNGADVISNSWGGGGYSQTLKDAIDYAHSQGAVLIAAAGNNNTSSIHYPAGYANMIAVAATNHNDERASFSNYGNWVDVAAPGRDIFATVPVSGNLGDASGYRLLSGTSMACPHVSGLAALILSRNPKFINEEVRSILKMTSNTVTTDYYIGQGRINAYNAVRVTIPPPVVKLKYLGASASGIIDIEGIIRGVDVARYCLYYGSGNSPTDWTLLIESSNVDSNGILYPNFDTSILSDGHYTFKLVVEDVNGQKIECRSSIKIDNIDIYFPMNNDVLRPGPIIEIQGRISDVFSNYTVEYGVGYNPTVWSSQGITLSDGADEVLATWDTSTITEDDFYNLRFILTSSSTTTEVYVYMFYFDTRLKPGWPQRVLRSKRAENSQHVNVADLDNDGYKEVITMEAADRMEGIPATLRVYRHDGTLWWSRVTNSMRTKGKMAIGDIDNDGFMEIFTDGLDVQNGSIDETYICGFNHDGTYIPGWPVKRSYRQGHSCSYLIADLNHDGEKELVTSAYWSPQLCIFDKSGSILLDKDLPNWTNSFESQQAVAVGNFDEDPDLEILTRYDNNGLAVFNMDGTMVSGWPIYLPTCYFSGAAVVGDVDNDGFDEVIVTCNKMMVLGSGVWSGESGIYVYDKNGNFMPGWPVLIENDDCSVFFRESAALADIDGDGDLEIAIASHNLKKQYFLHHTGEPVDGWPQIFRSFNFSISNNAIADINGDDSPDIILAAGGISKHVLRSGHFGLCGGIWAWNMDGTPIDLNNRDDAAHIYMEMSNTGMPPPVITDLDNDGMVDIVASSIEERIFSPSLEESSKSKDRNSIYVWELDAPYNSSNVPWPMFQHDPQRTGRYISPSNHPPFLYFIGNKAIYETHQLEFTISATDPDGDDLTYFASNLPEGAEFDVSTKTFSWIPNYEQAGEYRVIFEVFDEELHDSETITITVNNVNRTPTLSSIGNKTIYETHQLQFTTSATDPDGDDLTYSASNMPEGSNFNTSTKTFNWRPTDNQAGQYNVTFTASDGEAEDAKAINIVIKNITIPDTVSGINIVAVTSTGADLNWIDNSDREDGFKVYRSYYFRYRRNNRNRWAWDTPELIGTVNSPNPTATGDTLTFNDTTSSAGTLYRYTIKAYNSIGESGDSNYAEVRPQLFAPSDLTITSDLSSSIGLSFKDNSVDEQGFKLYRSYWYKKTKRGVKKWRLSTPELVGTVNSTNPTATGDTLTLNDATASLGVYYYYIVRAYNSAGESEDSNYVEITPHLPKPSDLILTSNLPSNAGFSFKDNSVDEQGFKLYRRRWYRKRVRGRRRWRLKPAELVDTVTSTNPAETGGVLTCEDTTASAGTYYHYVIRAYNSAGESQDSNGIDVTAQ